MDTNPAITDNVITLSAEQLTELTNKAVTSATEKAQAEVVKLGADLAEKNKVEMLKNMQNINSNFLTKREPTDESTESLISKALISTFLAKDNRSSGRGVANDFRATAEKLFGNDEILMKAMNASDAAEGGILVRPELSNNVIPYLQNAETFFNDIPTYPMTSGAMTIPKELSGATVSMNGELDVAAESQIAMDDIKLNSKRIDVVFGVSNQLLRSNTNVNILSWLEKTMRRSLIPKLEQQMLTGDGTANQFLGMYNITTGKFNSGGTTPELIGVDLGKLEEWVEGGNIAPSKGTYVMSTRSKNYLKNLSNDLGIFSSYANDVREGKLNGHKLYATNTVLNTYNTDKSRVYFFDAASMVKGVARNFAFEVVPFGTYKNTAGQTVYGLQQDLTVLKLSFEMDFGMFYAKAASVLEAVAWA